MTATPRGPLGRFAYPLTEEHALIRDAMLDYARDRIAPGAAERDKTRAYPLALVHELGAMGMLGSRVPLEHGGAGSDTVGYALAMEAIGGADAALGSIVAATNLVSKILSDHCTPEQRERWVRPLASGALGPASFCLTEPSGGSDAAALRTSAVRDGDDFVLNGSKMWITSGAHAGVYLVFARTGPAGGRGGISAFVVERGTPGLEVGKDEPKMGQRSAGTTALHFTDCRVPRVNLVGEVDHGYGLAIGSLGPGRIGIAALCVGIGEAALADGVAFASEREAFGSRVVDFQSSQFAIVDSRMELDQAWLLTLRAAFLVDGGQRAALETSMAKLAASEACNRIVDRMLQLHGGYGYSEEYRIERLYRDARVTRIYEGTSEVQRLVMSRELVF